jgi:hypothetical protein
MTTWPEFDADRLSGTLMRVDLQEARFLAVGEYHNVVDLLMRAAAAACLLDREEDGMAFVRRAAERTDEWTLMVESRVVPASTYREFAAARGMLATALCDAPEAVGWRFLSQTANEGPGPAQNARLAAAILVGDADSAIQATKLCELTDAGLGVPFKRFALALFDRDHAGVRKSLSLWLEEKAEATMTHDWGAYNEVPLEVSGAIAAAWLLGVRVTMDSPRILPRFRVAHA